MFPMLQPVQPDIQRTPGDDSIHIIAFPSPNHRSSYKASHIFLCSLTKLAFPPAHQQPEQHQKHLPEAKTLSALSPPIITLKHTSDPISLILISFSISITCCSSANANAHGTPSNSALVLITYSVLPLNSRPDFVQLVIDSTVSAM